MRRGALTGILTIAIGLALIGAGIGLFAFDLPIWAVLLVYSLTGTVAVFFVAWRRYRCAMHHERMHPERG